METAASTAAGGAAVRCGDHVGQPAVRVLAGAPGAPVRLRGAGAPPILVVGNTRDPATPFRWAKALARDLKSGVLLAWNGDGHTAYMMGSSCIDSAVDKYLISLVPPATGPCARKRGPLRSWRARDGRTQAPVHSCAVAPVGGIAALAQSDRATHS